MNSCLLHASSNLRDPLGFSNVVRLSLAKSLDLPAYASELSSTSYRSPYLLFVARLTE